MLTTKLLLNIHRMASSTAACAKYSVIYLIHICFAGNGIFIYLICKERQQPCVNVCKNCSCFSWKILLSLELFFFFFLLVASKYMPLTDSDPYQTGGLVGTTHSL